MSTTAWRILAFVVAAGAVSILLAPRMRPRTGERPWRIDQADTPAAAPPAKSPEPAPDQPANVALH